MLQPLRLNFINDRVFRLNSRCQMTRPCRSILVFLSAHFPTVVYGRCSERQLSPQPVGPVVPLWKFALAVPPAVQHEAESLVAAGWHQALNHYLHADYFLREAVPQSDQCRAGCYSAYFVADYDLQCCRPNACVDGGYAAYRFSPVVQTCHRPSLASLARPSGLVCYRSVRCDCHARAYRVPGCFGYVVRHGHGRPEDDDFRHHPGGYLVRPGYRICDYPMILRGTKSASLAFSAAVPRCQTRRPKDE